MKFESKPVAEHQEVPLADDGRWENLVEFWGNRENRQTSGDGLQRAYVVSVVLHRDAFPPGRQQEILGLVRAQGHAIAGFELCRLTRPDPRSLFRRGKAQELAVRATDLGADLLIVDAELSPSQTRNLEDATGLPVRDRESVILNVFQQHVKTRKARIQVEIAHLEYLRPRIRGLGLEMDQQAGGIMGSRGPGETASELLARQLDGRLVILRRAFAKVAKEGRLQRKHRASCQTIALLGYTNAGKTSLMNALTNAGLSAADQPFETLDTTSRSLARHGGDVLLSDTVGFIRNLPQRLLASFESTLSEIREASLLALVVDLSDEERQQHLQTTEAMLARLKVLDTPRLYVFNKADKLAQAPSPALLEALSQGHEHVLVSSSDSASVAMLRKRLLALVRVDSELVSFLVPYEATKAMGLVYSGCRVRTAESTETGVMFRVEADRHQVQAIKKALKEIL